MHRTDIQPAFTSIWHAEGGFEGLWKREGQLYKRVKERRTLRFMHGDRAFFIKIHAGVGWKEIFKNLLVLKLPVIGAKNEYDAIRHLTRIGVPTLTLAAYAERGINPASLRSFVITEDLGESLSLEHFCRDWGRSPPDFKLKRALIEEVAQIARRMHESGANHRDFYICHLLRRHADERLYVIDLHRAQLRRRLPQRWRIKDLAALYFSAMDIGLTRRDLLRFISYYRAQPLSQIFPREHSFWRRVEIRAQRLHRSPIRR